MTWALVFVFWAGNAAGTGHLLVTMCLLAVAYFLTTRRR